MYVDDSGGAEDATTTEEMTVSVDGEDYTTDMNADADADGTSDSAVVAQEDGSARVYHDSDGDAKADVYAEVDEQGNVTAQAQFDESSGEWVAVDPNSDIGSEEASAEEPTDSPEDEPSTSGENMEVTLPGGKSEQLPPPSVDTNDDGVPDTTVAKDNEGNTIYFTDADGDGEADLMVIERADGSIEAAKHEGGGEWSEVDTSDVSAPSESLGFGSTDDVPVLSGFSV